MTQNVIMFYFSYFYFSKKFFFIFIYLLYSSDFLIIHLEYSKKTQKRVLYCIPNNNTDIIVF